MMWNLSINAINMSLHVSIEGHYPFQRKHLEKLGQLKDAMPKMSSSSSFVRYWAWLSIQNFRAIETPHEHEELSNTL